MKILMFIFPLLFFVTTICQPQATTVVLSKTLTGHTEPVNCLSFSPDGKMLASGSNAESLMSDIGKFEIIIWNVVNGRAQAHLVGHHEPILSVSFNQLGNRLVSSDSKGIIKVWSIDSLKEIRTIEGGEWISTVCFTPDGRFIIGEYTFAKKVNIWDSESGELIFTLGINDQLGAMDISPDGSKIALSCYHKIQIWSLISQKQLLSVDDDLVNGFAIKYSPDGKSLAVGLGDGSIKMFDPETLSLRYTLQGHFKSVLSVGFNKDNKYLVSGSTDQMIKVWNLKTKSQLKSLVNEHKGTIEAVAFSPNSNTFETTGDDKTIKLWKIQ
jgi:WD40 repeat protein